MWRRWLRIVPVPLLLVVLYFVGCSKNPTRISEGRGFAPETQVTYAPVESSPTFYRVHLYWSGYDRDGEVIGFRFAIDADTSLPVSSWRATAAHDSIFTFSVEPGDTVGTHAFWIAAEDNDARLDPTPAKRRITIRTQPPTSSITSGPTNGAIIGPDVPFGWSGIDPDGSPTGGPAPAESFEYLLLRLGTAAEPGHPALPVQPIDDYVDLIRQADGPTLPAPYDDWKWIGTREVSHSFTGLDSAYYVFALRAVDAAGAREAELKLGQNIRGFSVRGYVFPADYAPVLRVTTDILINPVTAPGGDPIVGTTWVSAPIRFLKTDPVPLSWSATPGVAGTPVTGYAFALDDTTSETWTAPDLRHVGITLPKDLSVGSHSLFVRAIDAAERSTTAILRLEVVHAAFRDPAQPASFLYIDDFAAPPGDWTSALRGSPNFPSDPVEDDWWSRVLLTPLAQEFGLSFDQWDAVYQGYVHGVSRDPPSLDQLANYRVVIWSSDFALQSGLWSTTVGESWSALRAYVRGGGTLIVTGFQLAAQTSSPTTTPYSYYGSGMCAIDPGTAVWNSSYIVRDYMGLDGAVASEEASRNNSARDFVGARATSQGTALGFQAADVDTGAAGTGAKWNPYALPGSNPDTYLAPGLPKVEGWRLESVLGCMSDESVFRRENPGAPIVAPIYTYHGVNMGILQDGGPSRRENLVVGVLAQAHDDGKGDGSPVTVGSAKGVAGRMVFLGFPIYYVQDAQALAVMRAAFAYVNGSPTLVGEAP